MKLKGKIIGLIVVIIAIFFITSIWFGLKLKSEIKTMSAIDTGEIMKEIYCIKDGFVNLYIIKIHDTCIMIDAGNKAKIVEHELKKLKVEKEKIRAVFLTHSDADHTGSLDLFNNIPIYFSKEEEKIITGKEKRALMFKNKLDFNYTCIEDNQIIIIDSIEVRCILTPGHTTGSMCFEINGKYLFTGDTFRLIEGKVELFNDFFNMDSKTQEESIRKVATLKGIKAVFTGHHGYTENFDEAFREWR
jgi:glyoxylase-like metal-dependent hydrolase (beta-lactamase superfamily II)